MLNGELEYDLKDGGLKVKTNKGEITVKFDPEKYRDSEVPILLSNPEKIRKLGFKTTKTVDQIIGDQVNYYLDPEKRKYLIE